MLKGYSLLLACVLFINFTKEPVISWHDALKLTWADFKGPPKAEINAVATTASGITFGYSLQQTNNRIVGFSTEVFAHFYPQKSWYKKERATVHVLKHEQLHFDITELHARKFRKRIEELKLSNSIKKDLDALHIVINKELAKCQNTYDKETDFSRNFENQEKWRIYVKEELNKLSKYKAVK